MQATVKRESVELDEKVVNDDKTDFLLCACQGFQVETKGQTLMTSTK